MSNRADGRGHWQAGRRRNHPLPPAGWETPEAFLAALHGWLAAHGKGQELADYLGVHRKTLYCWLVGRKIPRQHRLKQLSAWWRATAWHDYQTAKN